MTKLLCRGCMIDETLSITNFESIVPITLSSKEKSKLKCSKCNNVPEFQI